MSIGLTLLVEIITFALFVYAFKKLLWKPLMGVMDARQARIAEGLAASDRGMEALQKAEAKSDDALREARDQARDILAAANQQAVQLVEQARETARTEGDRIVERAKAEVDREVQAARESLRRDVGRLAVQGAERILKREIDSKAHAQMLDQLAAEI
ncbi:MAG: F0F1 ATP synthase subunit B [Nevskiaceae bacterium]|nr:MAG: F0F1 ATP synthase subunit B [Nevskiaceae bacterium]TBR73569.1 MAG: F0F1 ATP synthase subunit B [Nevskiaceae bacterium]